MVGWFSLYSLPRRAENGNLSPPFTAPFLALSGVGLTFILNEKGRGLQFIVYHCKNNK